LGREVGIGSGKLVELRPVAEVVKGGDEVIEGEGVGRIEAESPKVVTGGLIEVVNLAIEISKVMVGEAG